MKQIISTFVVAFVYFVLPVAALAGGDCECPTVSCGPCKDQINLEFYTEKCGGGKKIKSCKKPICTDKDPLPATCQAASSPAQGESAGQPLKKEISKVPQKVVGAVIVAIGDCFVTRQDGEKIRGKTALKVFEGDSLETGDNGKMIVKLNNDNTMNLVARSKAIIQFHETNEAVHQTLINLMYGTIRSGVKKAPKDAKNDFKVKTPSAVAGVRGTDFVTTFTEKEGATKVETLTGLVELSSLSGSHKVEIPKGKYASYVVPSHHPNDIGDDDIEKFVERGHMTDVQELTLQDLAKIEDETSNSEQKIAAAQNKQSICSEPQAKLNQCFWKIEGGKCLRKRCNANGDWAEETRMPAQASEHCEGTKPHVETCDY